MVHSVDLAGALRTTRLYSDDPGSMTGKYMSNLCDKPDRTILTM